MASKRNISIKRESVIPAAVLAIDMVSYSLEFDEKQVTLVKRLNQISISSLRELNSNAHFLLPTGDGTIIVFPNSSPSLALECAMRISKKIKKELLRISIRMGIHYGQGIVAKDINNKQNLIGNAINLSQRVMDIGDENHILLSESAYEALKNTDEYANHLFAFASNPIVVKHGIKLNIFSYYDRECGSQLVPQKVINNIGLVSAKLGRPVQWKGFVETTYKLKIIGHSLRLLSSPDFQDVLENLIKSMGTEVQILVLNNFSTSHYLRKYSKAYKDTHELDSTYSYVIDSLKAFRRKITEENKKYSKKIDVKVFDTIPTFAGFITDDKAFISVYLENFLGSKGPFFECQRMPNQPSLYDCFDSAFSSIWQKRSISIFNNKFSQYQANLKKKWKIG